MNAVQVAIADEHVARTADGNTARRPIQSFVVAQAEPSHKLAVVVENTDGLVVIVDHKQQMSVQSKLKRRFKMSASVRIEQPNVPRNEPSALKTTTP